MKITFQYFSCLILESGKEYVPVTSPSTTSKSDVDESPLLGGDSSDISVNFLLL